MSMTEAAKQVRQERLLYLLSPIGLLVLWQLAIMVGLGDRRFVPAPTDIVERFWLLCVSGELPWDTVVTLWRIVAGFLLGAIPGVALGLAMAMWRGVRIIVDPLIAALFPIPKLALMPLILLAFGFGETSKIVVVAIGAFFPVIVNAYAGAANIDKIYIDVAHNYGASPRIMFTRVVFFGALPLIFAGLTRRARDLLHHRHGGRVHRREERHRLSDLVVLGAAAGRCDVRRHRDHRASGRHHLDSLRRGRAQSHTVEGAMKHIIRVAILLSALLRVRPAAFSRSRMNTAIPMAA